MKLENKLSNYKNKTITKDKISELITEYSDEALYEQIKNCCKKGLLEPIKCSKTNGNNVYTIYNKYKVNLPEIDYSIELSEISMLHIDLIKYDYLKKNPEVYKKYKKQIELLSKWLFANDLIIEKISKKERSFEIFNEEKELEDKVFWGILNHMGINEERLCFYNTPDYCFNDFIPSKKQNMTLLICENKDIWFNFRRLMFENNYNSFFDTIIDGVVLGDGYQISNKKGALTEYTKFLGVKIDSVEYLYWGDIDRAGLDIYSKATDVNPDLKIKLFLPAYKKMLDLAENREIPDSNDNRNLEYDFSKIFSLFDNNYSNRLKTYINSNKRIPQEIISYTKLVKEASKE